uniref:Tetratricopeptide TPR_2 repeat protein n=2 Tax=Gloeothece TaxID=28070 RepID=E0UKR0_GLOV7|nr:Tetratricopeptide TPR_2 repeat protein [Gloeothece verrucosa PCC 7822]
MFTWLLLIPVLNSQTQGIKIWQINGRFNNFIASNQETSVSVSNYTGFLADINQKAQQITVKIELSNNDNGSGVIIARNGQTYYILTASHVVQNSQETYQILTPDGEKYPVNNQTIKILEGIDMAVLAFTSPKTYTVAKLGNYDLGLEKINDLKQLKKGWIFVSGFPGNTNPPTVKGKYYLSSGRIWHKDVASFTTNDQYSSEMGNDLVYTAISYPGMSGGAVLDSEGRVIGINTGIEGNLGQSLGVSITTLMGVVSKTQIQPSWLTVESSNPPELTNDQVEQIRHQLFTLQAPLAEANADDWLNYCNALWRSSQYNEAIKACDKAIEKQPKSANAYYLKGLLFLYQFQYPEAIINFKKATQFDPKFHQAWRQQGFCFLMLEQYPDASTAYQQAIKYAPGEFVYYIEQAGVLKRLKNYALALEAYKEALKIKQHPWTYNNRGLLYSDLQKYKLALSDYNKAIALNPLLEQAYYNRGVLYSQLKKYELALSDYDKAIQLNPEDTQVYYNRGNLYKTLKEYDKALFDYNKAIEFNSEDAQAYNNRAVVYKELKEYKKALSDYNKAIEINPDDARTYYNRGILYKELEEYELALSDYSKAIEINPQLAFAYANRGILYAQTGNKKQAISDLQIAADLFRQQGNVTDYQNIRQILQQLSE